MRTPESAGALKTQTTASGATWELRLGDCIEGLRTLADKSVDVTLSDPPFSAGLYEKFRTNKRDRGNDERNNSNLRLLSNSIGAIDDILEPVATHLMRVTKRWIVVFSDVEICHRWRVAFGDSYIRTGAWVKSDPMPQISGDRPAQGMEVATIAHGAGRKRWNGGGRPAAWTHPTCRGAFRPDHPCPKPVSLMSELVELFTDRDELVLDPFSGSGTTGVACGLAGRRFLGWELDPTYFEIARRRLAGEESKPRPEQPSLFGGAL